jgi:vacuolar-type H+-ATPase subunit E/Vma4
MSIIILGLIVNTASFSDLAFADKPDKAAKEAREEVRADAKEAREEVRADAKEAREEIKEFSDSIVVTSSSSSSTEKVTICHIPPGNPANAHTITVGSPAVRAHEAHGDLVDGSCESEEFNPDDYESKKESRLSESSDKESNALERAKRLIEKLEQQVSNLEERLQTLLEKYESGEYYGNISTADSVTNSYNISFEGIASSIYDESVTTEMSGELFMENQVTTSDTSKFKIISGEVIIGDAIYDVAFGKARGSSSGPSGEEDSMVIVLQTIDSEENENTIKMTLGFTSPLEGEFGNPDEEFEILDNSKVSGQWVLDGSGQLSLES